MSNTKIQQLSGTGIPLLGNDIDTDQIVPARFLREITFKNMGKYLFYDDRFDLNHQPKPHPLNDSTYQGASFLFVERNFGCGSSREHAAQAIRRFGIKVIVGLSYSEIFLGNCKSVGIPAVTVSEEVLGQLLDALHDDARTPFGLDLNRSALTLKDKSFPVSFPNGFREAFITGAWNAVSVLKSYQTEISRLAETLPYVKQFRSRSDNVTTTVA